MSSPISIIIVDDHPVVREGLRALFSTEASIDIIGEASNGQHAVQLIRDLQPDLILLDLMMKPMGGIEVIQQVKAFSPNARILALTSFADDDSVFAAIKAGALGYQLKDSPPNELVRAIHEVYQGNPSLSPSIALKVINDINTTTKRPETSANILTERELLILKHVAQGLTNQEIAELFVISERTVRNHVGNILNKLHLANRTQAALYAVREGIINIDELNNL